MGPAVTGGDGAERALWTWALRIAARGGTHVARVALARRLAGILYALLRDGSVFQPQALRRGARNRAEAAHANS